MKTNWVYSFIVPFFFLGTGLLLSQALYAQNKDTTAAPDAGWPRQIKKNKMTLVYYQPQIDEWKDYKTLSARVAFSMTPDKGAAILGVVSLKCNTIVEKETRTVYLKDIAYEDIRFPSLK